MSRHFLYIFIYTLTFISLVGSFYSIWHGYQAGNKLVFYIGIAVSLIILFNSICITVLLARTVDKARKIRNTELLDYIETKHVLCASLLCSRCSAWYISFTIIFASVFNNPSFWANIAIKIGYKLCFVFGLFLLFLSTPIHGTVTRIYQRLTHPALKFILGFLTGLSCALIAGAVMIWLRMV
jgi:hypothetical protein